MHECECKDDFKGLVQTSSSVVRNVHKILKMLPFSGEFAPVTYENMWGFVFFFLIKLIVIVAGTEIEMRLNVFKCLKYYIL